MEERHEPQSQHAVLTAALGLPGSRHVGGHCSVWAVAANSLAAAVQYGIPLQCSMVLLLQGIIVQTSDIQQHFDAD